MNFPKEDILFRIMEPYPFNPKLVEAIKECLDKAQDTGDCRILVAGNKRSGKTTFIQSMADKFNLKYVLFGFNDPFDSDMFWSSVEDYLKDHDRVLLHCHCKDHPSELMRTCRLNRPPQNVLGRVLVVYECDDVQELFGIDDVLIFPPMSRILREKMLANFLKSVRVRFMIKETLLNSTQGYEIGDIFWICGPLRDRIRRGQLTLDFLHAMMRSYNQWRPCLSMRRNISWGNVSGLDTIVEAFKNIANHVQEDIRISQRDGILLHGPRGCGKTILAEALCTHLEFIFITLCCPDIMNMYEGETRAKKIVEIFESARKHKQCVLFVDQIDALCSQRDDDNGGNIADENNIVNVFLNQLDGINRLPNSRIIVIGATRFKDRVDEAILRGDRFGRHFEVPSPDSDQRCSFLETASKYGTKPKIYYEFINEADGTEMNIFRELAKDEYTKDWSYAKLLNLINAVDGIRRKGNEDFVNMAHVLKAHREMVGN